MALAPRGTQLRRVRGRNGALRCKRLNDHHLLTRSAKTVYATGESAGNEGRHGPLQSIGLRATPAPGIDA